VVAPSWFVREPLLQLRVDVLNHDSAARAVDVSWETDRGVVQGQVTSVGPCTSMGWTVPVGESWWIAEAGTAAPDRMPAIVTSGDVPDDPPAVTIVFTGDGPGLWRRGSAAPADATVAGDTPPLC
jgi:hypothetical protein